MALKLQLHLDNNDDPDPASRTPLGDMLGKAPAVLAAALEDLPEGKLVPDRVEISLSFPRMSSPSPCGKMTEYFAPIPACLFCPSGIYSSAPSTSEKKRKVKASQPG